MTDAVRPFKIFGIKEFPDGKLIAYEVSRRFLGDDDTQQTQTLRATAFAPLDADVDSFMFNYLKDTEWLS